MEYNERKDGFTDSETTGRTVVGLFHGRAAAEAATRDLKSAGFTEAQIGVAHRDSAEERDLIESTGSGSAAEGAAVGALSGGLLGGVIGLLGSLLIPGVGPIVVGGVLGSTLTGAGIGAAAGGIIGALSAMGVPEADARHFDLGLRSGGILVAVDAGARTREALSILERHGMDFGPSGLARYGSLDRATGAEASQQTGTGGIVSGLGATGVGVADVASGSSTRGMPPGGERRSWNGRERRTRHDPAYAGPERRFIMA